MSDGEGSDYDVDSFFGYKAPKPALAPAPAARAAPAKAAPRPSKQRPTRPAGSDDEDAADGDVEMAEAAASYDDDAEHEEEEEVELKRTRRSNKKKSAAAAAATPTEPEPEIEAIPETSEPGFAPVGVNATLAWHLETRMNLANPTPIQRAVYSSLLGPGAAKNRGRDVAIQSETGSGKTLSFLVPIIQSILFPTPAPEEPMSRELGPLCLVLSPTRELALQIHGVLENLTNISRNTRGAAAASADAEGEEIEDAPAAADQEQEQIQLPDGVKIPRRWLVSSTIVGGEKKKAEKARIRKGLNIIVSTPGRFLDHLRTTRNLDVSRVRWVVLDEADRLLDLGFERDLKAIFAYLKGEPDPGAKTGMAQARDQPPKGTSRPLPPPPTPAWPKRRQVFLCSATMHKVAHLAAWVLENPLHVSAAGISEGGAATLAGGAGPSLLKHQYIIAPLKTKLLVLASYLAEMARGGSSAPRKLIVFFSTRGAVDFYHLLLARFFSEDRTDRTLGYLSGLDVMKLHGSMDANERKSAIGAFSGGAIGGKAAAQRKTGGAGKGQVLITTDVAARGLDLQGVDMIIQFDAPTEVAEYVHRVGRTARAGRKGAAVLLLAPHEEEFATVNLKEKLETLAPVDVNKRMAKLLRLPPDVAGSSDEWEKAAVRLWQMPMEDWVARDRTARNLATLGFQAQVKGYATYPSNLKTIFHVRKLHLGHLATTFCLRDAPTDLKSLMGQGAAKNKDAAAGGAGADGKKRKFADGVESYAKTAADRAQRSMASEFNTAMPMRKKQRK
ncbi:ATP-dependent RNA helicase dbp7 [Blastocladiella emersonii ATCC 22665]|nr:ATP-dependent RNA helicase dbp7 [Blastocladiella emersonii ATCC 22665]